METIRYEAMRIAAQDFELLKLVEHCLPAEQAQAAIARAIQHILRAPSLAEFVGVAADPPVAASSLYSLNPADYAAARRELLAALG